MNHQGAFTYPPKSLMKNTRDYQGLRLIFGEVQSLSWGQKWNPKSATIPYMTLADHKLIHNEAQTNNPALSVEGFHEAVLKAVEERQRELTGLVTVHAQQGDILIESYASLSSLIFNQSQLGYFKDRNGVSF